MQSPGKFSMLLILFFGLASAFAQNPTYKTTTLNVLEDATISENRVYGVNDLFLTKNTITQTQSYLLIKFSLKEIANRKPYIKTAKLVLQSLNTYEGKINLKIQRITGAWNESMGYGSDTVPKISAKSEVIHRFTPYNDVIDVTEIVRDMVFTAANTGNGFRVFIHSMPDALKQVILYYPAEQNPAKASRLEISYSDEDLPVKPEIICSGSNNTLCAGDSAILRIGAQTACTYQWYKNNQAIPGATDSFYTANSPGVYQAMVSNETGFRKSDILKIYYFPFAHFQLAKAIKFICLGAAPITLTGGKPAGGYYSGKGVADNKFDPMVAGGGTHAVTYQYQDTNNCPATVALRTITVLDTAEAGTYASVCPESDTVWLNRQRPTHGLFSGQGVVNDYFLPSLAGQGLHKISFISEGCKSDTALIRVYIPAKARLPDFTPVCLDHEPFELSGGSPLGGKYFGEGVTLDGRFIPKKAGNGKHQINYTFTNVHNCIDTATAIINVLPLPRVLLTLPLYAACIEDTLRVLSGGFPSGGSYIFYNDTVTSINPSKLGYGSYILFYAYTNQNGCTNSNSTQFSIPQIIPKLNTFGPFALSDSPAALTGSTPTGGNYSGPGVEKNIFYPAKAGVGKHTIRYSEAAGCRFNGTALVQVFPFLDSLIITGKPKTQDAVVRYAEQYYNGRNSYLFRNDNFGGENNRLSSTFGCYDEYYLDCYTFLEHTVIKFDLDTVLPTKQISGATLFLHTIQGTQGNQVGNVKVSQLNANWQESLVTWNTLPVSGNEREVITQVIKPTEIALDVTDWVKSMYANPAINFGFLLKPTFYNSYSKNFASSEHEDAVLHPRLVIRYFPSANKRMSDQARVLESVQISPNPLLTMSRLTVVSKEPLSDATLIISDLEGIEIKRIKMEGNIITIEKGNLISGIYFYRIIEKDAVLALGKFVVQ